MKRLLKHALQIVPLLLAVGLLLLVLRSADLGRSVALVRSLGWRIALLPLPALSATLLETLAWWLAFGRLGPRPRFTSLFGVRLVGEAVLIAMPSGAVVAESLQPYLLKRRCGVPFDLGIVAGVARKFFVIGSHGLFLALSTALAWPALVHTARGFPIHAGLPWLLLATAAGLALAAIGTAAVGVHGRVADRLRRGLDRLGGRWMGSWLERNALRFQSTDDHLASFFRGRRGGLLVPLVLTTLGWLMRAIETLLFLALLGVAMPLTTAMVMEAALIFVRSMAVPVPAGLGVQDFGYIASLKALGVQDAVTVGAAFVLLKRGRELLSVLVGFTVFTLGRQRAERSLVSATPP